MSNELSFAVVDDFALARSNRKAEGEREPNLTVATELGPLIELAWYGKRTWEFFSKRILGFEDLLRALRSQKVSWVSSDQRLGFLRVQRDSEDTLNSEWLSYCLSVQHAFQSAGVRKHTAQQMIGAIIELEENIHLHSEASHTGLILHCCQDQAFEFVVADRGIGVLASLSKRDDFVGLADHGTALRTALQDGNSSLGREGVGFHDLFVGLANLSAKLRFRSGDYALVIDGTSPALEEADLIQLASLKGFLVSVRCSVPSGGRSN